MAGANAVSPETDINSRRDVIMRFYSLRFLTIYDITEEKTK